MVVGSGRVRAVTVVVFGQSPIQILLPRGQFITHTGPRTVWAGTLNEAEEAELTRLLRILELVIDVHVVDPNEGALEREALHRAPPGEIGALPTVECPTCAWLDHSAGEFRCGIEAWHPVVAQAFHQGKAAEDLRRCPAGRPMKPQGEG